VLPALRWLKRSFPYWNASVAAGAPRHVLAISHEEGWGEVWQLLHRWLAGNGDHANTERGWDDLHPASPTRQLAALQYSGVSDYVAEGGENPRRGVSPGAPCRICFQPKKDVMIPGFPGIPDYPDSRPKPRGGKMRSDCDLISALSPESADRQRPNTPRLFFAGAVQTKSHGPGLYEPSRLVLYNCWKNRTASHNFEIVQTENVLISVHPWEVEKPVDALRRTRDASLCAVPEGKIGSYGHRAIIALLLGCVPLFTKESYSHHFFDEPGSALEWSNMSLSVPPAQMPQLSELINAAAPRLERLRATGFAKRRRLLWTSIYTSCHLRPGEGGEADAFETLMALLRTPRVHFQRAKEHQEPRAPEMLADLYPWLKSRGGQECTHGYQCFDKYKRSCG